MLTYLKALIVAVLVFASSVESSQSDFWRGIKLTGVKAKLLDASLPEGSRIVAPPSLVAGRTATLSVVSPQGDMLKGVVVVVAGQEHVSDSKGKVSFTVPEGRSPVEARIKDFKGALAIRTAVAATSSDFDANLSPIIAKVPRYHIIGSDITIEGGPFDGDIDSNRVRIGDRDISVLASSPTSLVTASPKGLQPGDSRPLTVATQQGESPAVNLTFIRIRMEASATNLLKGQNAKGRIIVEGTRERVWLRITNLTPNVIRLKGGDSLTVRTEGGSDNAAEIKFTGVSTGGFTINAEVIKDMQSN